MAPAHLNAPLILMLMVLTIGIVAGDRLQNTYSSDGGEFLTPPRYEPQKGTSGGVFAQASKSAHGSLYVPPASPSGPVPSGPYPGKSYSQHSVVASAPVAILRFNNNNPGDGTYRFAYETENHISQQESGKQENSANVVQGSYSYTGPDGHTYTVTYIADEKGFVASGEHLPTPPPSSAAKPGVTPGKGQVRPVLVPTDAPYPGAVLPPSREILTPPFPTEENNEGYRY